MFGDRDASSLNAYYREQTYDQLGFSGARLRPVRHRRPRRNCSYSSSTERQRLGLEQARPPRRIAARPTSTTSSSSRMSAPAAVGRDSRRSAGSHVWINGEFEVPVVAHELGHNLGLAHAAGLLCANGTPRPPLPMGSSCSAASLRVQRSVRCHGPERPYGGGPLVLRQMSMQHKLELNLLPASAVQVVERVRHVPPRADGVRSRARPRCCGSRGPAAATTSSSTASRSATSTRRRRPSPACTSAPSRRRPSQGAANSPNADTALIDMHPTPARSSPHVGRREDGASARSSTTRCAASRSRTSPRMRRRDATLPRSPCSGRRRLGSPRRATTGRLAASTGTRRARAGDRFTTARDGR